MSDTLPTSTGHQNGTAVDLKIGRYEVKMIVGDSK